VVARLTQLPRPFIVAIITERTSAAAAAVMRRAAHAGAHAYELNLPLVEQGHWDAMRGLVASSGRPVYTSCRRATFMEIYGRGAVPTWDDEERMARQLDLLDHGSVALDVELDAFDAEQPSGVAHGKSAVAKQIETAARARAHGKEVIFSCHAKEPLSRDEILARVRLAETRGGNLAKVVAPARDEEQAVEYLAAAAVIRREGMLPTTVIAAGDAGRLTRLVAPVLARSWALCQERVTGDGFPEQPPVAETREALRVLTAFSDGASGSRSRSDDASSQ
jgi:3-dehydroquinate dehydratase